jgi:hypothetical protein
MNFNIAEGEVKEAKDAKDAEEPPPRCFVKRGRKRLKTNGGSSASSAESKLKPCKSLIGVNTLSSGFDITQGGFEAGNDVDHGAIQKRRGWIFAPLRARSVQD